MYSFLIMNTDIVAKSQWLEKKCKEYKIENQKLRKRLQRLEKLSSDRGIPSQMYNHEVQYGNCLIRDVLIGNSEAYQNFMKIQMPNSYNDLYNSVIPNLRKYFVVYIKTYKKYLDFIKGCTYEGPIFTSVTNDTNVSLRDKLTNVRNKLNKYRSLLESSSWSVSLDEVARKIRKEILDWINLADSIVKDIDAQLAPKDLNKVFAEMDDREFEP